MAELPDFDDFLFDWFNERDPDAVKECLIEYAELARKEPTP